MDDQIIQHPADIAPLTKLCTKCGEVKPLTDFSYHTQNRRERPDCKSCVRAHSRQYTAANREQLCAASRAYYAANRERIRAEQKSTYLEKAPIERARMRAAYATNREAILVRHAHRRARKAGSTGSFTLEEWQALKAKYNHTCVCCGKPEPQIVLTADHIISLAQGGDNFISNIQPLCKSCNVRKGARGKTDYRLSYEPAS